MFRICTDEYTTRNKHGCCLYRMLKGCSRKSRMHISIDTCKDHHVQLWFSKKDNWDITDKKKISGYLFIYLIIIQVCELFILISWKHHTYIHTHTIPTHTLKELVINNWVVFILSYHCIDNNNNSRHVNSMILLLSRFV